MGTLKLLQIVIKDHLFPNQLTGLLYSSLADTERQQPDLQFFFNGFYAECSATGEINEPVGDCPQNGMNIS